MTADVIHTPGGERAALPTASTERKRTPLCTGLLDYAPAALTSLVGVISGFECHAQLADDLIEALRDRDWASVCVIALCDLDVELDGRGNLNRVHSLDGLFMQFAVALAAVAQVSWYGNQKHNPGQPLHHARGKSNDHADCIARHHVERGGFDGPMRHSACKLWRALVAWQEDLEASGAPLARGARLPGGAK